MIRRCGLRSGCGVVACLLMSTGLVGTAAPAHAFELWDNIKKKVEDIRRSPATVVKPQIERLPDAGREAARVLVGFSLEEEVAIGRKAAGSLLGAAPLVKDPRLQTYVNQVGRWVAIQSERPDLEWRFGVIDSNDINAFAAPGGFVLITRGLYRLLRNESELAGVLAHEIAHIVNKDHLTVMEQSRLVDRAKNVVSERVGDDEQIRKLIGSGAEIFARALDKKAEHEADKLAMVLAARAGYDPFGLPMVLQDLALAAKDHSRIRLLFKTHPHPDERLAYPEATGARLEGLPGKTNAMRFITIRP